jgi:hypothetical protein
MEALMPTRCVRSIALFLVASSALACTTEAVVERSDTRKSGVIECSPPQPASGIPTIHPADPHRLAIDGKTWFPVGFYNGSLSVTDAAYGTGAAALYTANHDLIDRLADDGLNFYRTWLSYDAVFDGTGATLLYPYLRTGPGTAADGNPKLDLDAFDPEYFGIIADAIDYAKNRGVVAQVILIHCGLVEYTADNIPLSFLHPDNNIQGLGFSNLDEYYATSGPIWDRHRAFIEKVVTTIGDRPNIVWEVCNEKAHGFGWAPSFDATRSDPFLSAMANEIRSLGSSHLIVGTDLPQHSTVAGHHVPQADQDIDAYHAAIAAQWAWDVPLLSDNDCCPGEADASLARQKAWAALTAGAHVDMFSEATAMQAVLHGGNALDGTRYLGYVRSFLDGQCIDLAGMHPDDSLVESGNGWALTRTGDELIVYARHGGAITLAGLPSSYDAIWFDPTSGDTHAAGSGPTFADPGGNAEGQSDWVLFVRSGEPACSDGACSAVCGDGACDGGETCQGCPSDCGACGACPFDGAIVGLADQVVDVEWASHDTGAIAQIYPPHGGANQIWSVDADGLVRVYGDRCLTAFWDGDGAPVGIGPCTGEPDQIWSANPDGSIVGIGGRCLDVQGADATVGTDLIVWPCHGGANQSWIVCGA